MSLCHVFENHLKNLISKMMLRRKDSNLSQKSQIKGREVVFSFQMFLGQFAAILSVYEINETLDGFPAKCLVCTALPAQLIWYICETGCTFPTHLKQPEYFRPIFGEEKDVSKHFQLQALAIPCCLVLPPSRDLAEDSLTSPVLKLGLS